MFEIVELDDINEKLFWDYVLSDVPRYFFFILDLKQYPESCRLFLAIEDESIVGLCLIWKNRVAQVRGHTEDIVKALIEVIPEEIPIEEISVELKYKELLHSMFPKPKKRYSIHRMVLKKEKMISRFSLDKPFTERILTKEDAPEIVKLMVKADPFYWGKTSSKDLTFDENQNYYGLFDGTKLICFTLAWIDEEAAIISTAATLPKYQNKGLATYLVNETIHKMMEHTEIAIIHVIIENEPAIRVYSKVGYEIYITNENIEL